MTNTMNVHGERIRKAYGSELCVYKDRYNNPFNPNPMMQRSDQEGSVSDDMQPIQCTPAGQKRRKWEGWKQLGLFSDLP